MAGKTHFRILTGIDDLVAFSTTVFRMQAPGTVAHLTAFDLDAFHRDSDSFVGSELEIPDFFLMTHGASFGTDVLGAFHLMVFQDFGENLSVHFATGGKKRNGSKN